MYTCCSDGTESLCQILVMVVSNLARSLLTEERGEYLQIVLTVGYPAPGKYLLIMESGLLKEIIRNTHGYDELWNYGKFATSGELLNILAARFMQVIMPPTAKYELSHLIMVESSMIQHDETCTNFLFNLARKRLVFSVISV